ncbi:MAG: fibronectin type III domain-containing protein [Candidatus Pacebacteria bacterium]|nr:fibronectin type III domain-containing protein [Candidatus Paceibacterota bacterium]
MNNISIAKIHTAVFLAFMAMVIALFGGIQVASAQVPEISTYPSSEITSTTAVFSGVVFNTGNKATTAWFEYGTSPSSLNLTAGLSGVYQRPENRTVKVRNLKPDTTYYYRLVAENSEGRTRGQRYELKTLETDIVVSTNTSSQSSGNNTGSGNTTSNNTTNNQSTTNNSGLNSNSNTNTNGSSVNTNAGGLNLFSGNNADSGNTNFSDQDIVGESQYSRLSIENGIETVFPGETFTYRVVYHNKTNADVASGKLVISIPEGFEILAFSKGLHEPESSVIIVQLGTIEAKSTDEVTVLVRATSASQNYVVATAELTVAVGNDQLVDTVRARDVDAYGAGSGLKLGASASGTGAFGNIMLVFIIVIVVGAIILMSARIIMKKRRITTETTEYNVEDLN